MAVFCPMEDPAASKDSSRHPRESHSALPRELISANDVFAPLICGKDKLFCLTSAATGVLKQIVRKDEAATCGPGSKGRVSCD